MSIKPKHKCGAGDSDAFVYLSPAMADDSLARQVRDIKRKLRSVMNGVASDSMKEKGLNYKVNYGVPFVIVKEIASKITPNHELAQLLWAENVRELNIIATMVQPVESFSESLAEAWMARISNAEQAEQICMNLLRNCDFAQRVALQWLLRDEEFIQFTGWHLLARVARQQGSDFDAEIEHITERGLVALKSTSALLFTGAILALKRVGVKKKFYSELILNKIKESSFENESKKRQIIEDLSFEFQYYVDSSL